MSLTLIFSLSDLFLNKISVNVKEVVEKTASYYKEIDKAVQAPRNYNSLTLEQKAIYDKSIEFEVTKYRGEAAFNEKRFREDVKLFVFTDDSNILKSKIE